MKLKRKAISFVFNALYQTEDGSKVRCVYVGRESGARMMMVEGHPSQRFLKCWDFPVDAYGMASVSGLNIVGLWKEVFNLKIGQKYKTKSGLIFDVKFQEDGFFICGEGLWRYNNQGKLEPDTENGELDFVELVQEVENTDSRKIQEVSSKYEKACVENYELRKVVEDLQAKLANAKSSELKAQTDLNKTLDDFEKLEERIFVLKQAEKNLLDSLDNKTEIINQLQRNEMGLEDCIRELKDRNAALENKLSSIEQLFKSVFSKKEVL